MEQNFDYTTFIYLSVTFRFESTGRFYFTDKFYKKNPPGSLLVKGVEGRLGLRAAITLLLPDIYC